MGVLAGLVLLASLKANPTMETTTQSATDVKAPAIVVTGNGESKADPDMATVTVGVQAQNANAKAAQEQVNRVATAIRDAALKIVGDRKFLQTSNLSIYPQYGQNGRVTGYTASNTITVRVEDLTKVGDVVDAATSNGANRIDGIGFGLKNPKSARAESLKDAVADARSKAEAIASAMGVTLGAPLEVIEGGYNVPMPMARMGMADAMEMKAGAPVEAGQLSVGSSVTIRYSFR